MRDVLSISSSEAANIMTNCMGILNILAIFGGFLAEVKFGRYKAIVIFACICTFGLALVSLATSNYGQKRDEIAKHKTWMAYVGLYTIACGAAGIKSNAAEFGSDQFDESNPQELKAMARFFNMFYLCLNVGPLFAITVLEYVQDQFGRYAYGIWICTGVMIIALVLLLHKERSYRFKKPQGSPLTVIWRVLFSAWKNRKISYPDHSSLLNGQTRFRFHEKATIVDGSRSRKEDKRMLITPAQVEDVKEVIKLIPVWAVFILFWTVHAQMDTFTMEQAAVMKSRQGKLTIPTSSLSNDTLKNAKKLKLTRTASIK